MRRRKVTRAGIRGHHTTASRSMFRIANFGVGSECMNTRSNVSSDNRSIRFDNRNAKRCTLPRLIVISCSTAYAAIRFSNPVVDIAVP
ncbi:hypothetical protein SAMN04489745_3101 [Arthrobacter woluwensis]|uniref:Uncharacterized protein n=1 Tax=Arthrobacter woluwensis TaxID=156980 RepID=A0A1H4I4T9_9MICC|nr:hypothetical protein SAMN04489745_0024 [Arthrobacter woluwensis]SEC52935.1 hypothetical protein SAMN04489745_3101 [Arthrobacter woluwensis]